MKALSIRTRGVVHCSSGAGKTLMACRREASDHLRQGLKGLSA